MCDRRQTKVRLIIILYQNADKNVIPSPILDAGGGQVGQKNIQSARSSTEATVPTHPVRATNIKGKRRIVVESDVEVWLHFYEPKFCSFILSNSMKTATMRCGNQRRRGRIP